MSEKIDVIKTKKSKPNYAYSILSVALVLFLLGFFGLIALHANKLVRLMKEQVNILVEIKPGTEQEQIKNLQLQIDTSRFTKIGSVEFISKEKAMEQLKTELGEDFIQFDLQNPLYDMIRFNTKSDYLSSNLLQSVKKQLKLNESVSEVYFQEGLVDKISKNIKKAIWFSVISGGLLLLIALVLIHNTIKLALYANRMIIKNMELVGASWGFISRPYIRKSIWHGILSATLAIGALVLVLLLAQREITELRALQDIVSALILFATLLILGVLISGVSTWYVINKYLKMRLDDLY